MKTEYQNRIITKLKMLRDERGLSQASMAHFLGISPGQLGNIESCKRNHKYTLKQLYALCQEFDLPLSKLFSPESQSDNTFDQLVRSIIRYEENEP